jgi:tetratricopeptide (TPR) repeat protein
MSNLEKLKKKAAEFEQKKQFDRALETYVQIIEQTKENDEKDVAIYNRVGDLYLRLTKTDQAVHYYEQAVDLYTDGGYLNNAIALCNKILRHAPKRNQIYYKLGKISAKKGFNSDAKKNFLEYADRMHKAGRDTDAFKALEEFADLCPGQDDIRLMLAEQLAKAGKTAEAVEQLQILHESLDAEGRTSEAQAAVKRMHMLDPNVEPRRSNSPRATQSGGLVFLDLGHSPPRGSAKIPGFEQTSLAPEPPSRPRTPTHVQPPPEIDRLSDLELDTPITESPPVEADLESIAGLEPDLDTTIGELELSPLEGLESAAGPESFELSVEPPANPEIDGLIDSMSQDVFPDPLVGMDSRSMETPFDTSDPLTGLSVLEDDRWYDDNPLEGIQSKRGRPDLEHKLTPNEPAPAVEPPSPPPAEVDESEPVAMDSLELEDAEDEAPPPSKKASGPRLVEVREKARPEPKPEPEQEQETEPSDANDEPSDEPQQPGQVERKFPFNPFKRTAQAKKAGARSTPPRAEQPKVPKSQKPRDNSPNRSGSAATKGDADFVDLADWLREDSAPRSTRMIAKDDKRVGDEQADFTDMLEKFKAGVAANVDDEDFDSHYDLGVAYREMGLIDEAVAEFQKALRGATQRIRAYEALGQCFIDRAEYDVAITVLSRALREPGLEDDDLIAVLYLLGYAAEENNQPRDASAYYQRVFAIDIDFRDVGERLKTMSKAASQ